MIGDIVRNTGHTFPCVIRQVEITCYSIPQAAEERNKLFDYYWCSQDLHHCGYQTVDQQGREFGLVFYGHFLILVGKKRFSFFVTAFHLISAFLILLFETLSFFFCDFFSFCSDLSGEVRFTTAYFPLPSMQF